MSESARNTHSGPIGEANSSLQIQEGMSRILSRAEDRISAAGGPRLTPLSVRRQIVDQVWSETKELLKGTKTPFSCLGKGCWGCCRGQVSVSPSEVTQIWDSMNEASRERVKRHRGVTEDIERKAICPLLDLETRECSVWASRPLACRAYNVISPVDDCYPERVGDRETAMVGAPILVISEFMSADMEAGENWTTLLRALVDRTLASEACNE